VHDGLAGGGIDVQRVDVACRCKWLVVLVYKSVLGSFGAGN